MNNSRSRSQVLLILCLLATLPLRDFAHEVPVHRQITFHAGATAVQMSPGYNDFISTIGGPISLSYDGNHFTPFLWMMEGAAREDDTDADVGGKRSYNHFYDPISNLGLSDRSDAFTMGLLGRNSFVWATTDAPGLDILHLVFWNVNTHNEWAWNKVRDYQWQGLTQSSRTTREENLAKMFRGLGDVIHLLQDTTQPQHTRNEQHLDKILGAEWLSPYHSPIERWGLNHVGQLDYTHAMLDWRAAGFTKVQDFWDRDFYSGASAQPLIDSENKNLPAKKLGLAEWVNGNFIGDRHTYAELFPTGNPFRYPFPSLNTGTDWNDLLKHPELYGKPTVVGLGVGVGDRYIVAKTGQGRKFLYHGSVVYLVAADPDSGLTPGPYSATVDDPDVLFSYHSILIPEAVKYSAGLIDYFFRGRLDVSTTYDLGTQKYTVHIINRSTQELKGGVGGAFHLFYENGAGTRTELTGPAFTCPAFSSLASGASIDAQLQPQPSASRYILVYKGNIGTTTDPADINIAIAAKNFTVSCDQPVVTTPPTRKVVATIAGPPSVYDDFGGVFTTTLSGFSVPGVGGSVTVTVDDASGGIRISGSGGPGQGVIVQGLGEFEVIDFQTCSGDPFCTAPETLTLRNNGIPSNADPGTSAPAGTQIEFREDLESWKAVYVPTVNRIFVNCAWDTIAVYDPDSMSLESYFHASNLIDDYNFEPLVYACDVDRLYTVSSYGNVFVINPHTHKTETVIPFDGGGSGFFGLDLSDGFFDPVNHRVGFGYRNLNIGRSGVLVINTLDNTVAGDLFNSSSGFAAAEYSAGDNRIYVSDDSKLKMYAADTLNYVTTVYAPSTIWLMRFAAVSGETYGRAGNSGFYIDPFQNRFDSTTADFTAPAINANVDIQIHDTSGLIAGNNVLINASDWQIVSVGGPTVFTAKNLSVTPGTLLAHPAFLSWTGPGYNPLPAVGSVNGLSYSPAYQKVFFNNNQGKTTIFNPVNHTSTGTIGNPDDLQLFYGCDGPNGFLCVPYQFNPFPYESGLRVLH